MSDTIVRNYHEDDIEELIDLYNSSSFKCPFFVRNPDFVEHFMRYPGVQGGIFVAQKDREVEGIAIVSIAEKADLIEGTIIELRAKNASTIDLLVQATLQYCRNKGGDIVYVRPPIHEGTAKIFGGWIKADSGVVMAKPLSISPILRALLDTDLVKKYYAGISLSFVFDEEIIRVETTANTVQVEELDKIPHNQDVMVTMSSKTALEIIFGWTNPYIAYLARKIKIRGMKNTFQILRLLHSISIKSPWDVALVDDV